MVENKVISVQSRPRRVSQLCFETEGILGQLHLWLGDVVEPFDFAAFYAMLGSMPTFPANPSRLLFNFPQIQEYIGKAAIAELRAEPLKAALNAAINARQNTYFAKHANAPAIIDRMRKSYDPGVQNSKANRLEVLTSLAEEHWKALREAYIEDKRTGVEKSTRSEISALSRSQEIVHQSGQMIAHSLPYRHSGGKIGVFVPDGNPMEFNASERPMSLQFSNSGSSTEGNSHGSQNQRIFNFDYSYRHPYLEGAAQYQRSMISLIDQSMGQFMDSQVLPYLTRIFRNELQTMDGGVFQRQIAFLNTLLMSPIPGVIAAVYKNPGEPVSIGEPIVRIEDNSEVILTVRLARRAPIALGTAMKIETQLFGEPGPITKLDGAVLAVRGLPEDDRVEVDALFDNLDDNGEAILPPWYRFDETYTKVIT